MSAREARTAALDQHSGEAPIHVVARGDVAAADRDYAVRKLVDVASRATMPLMALNVRVSVAGDPARARPASVECSVDCSGHVLRAHAAADTIREAADLVVERLQRLLHRVEERARSARLRHRDAGPGEWHHGDAVIRRPPFYDRPVDEREIVARKAIAPEAETVDDAVVTLELLDHDFLMFRDVVTGAFAVVHRLGGDRYELFQQHRRVESVDGCEARVALSPAVAPEQAVADAVERLDVGGEPFVFFVDADTGRASVVYRRYDGHYGLISATS
jgi:ribosome-associated translation inhibitor RaiA